MKTQFIATLFMISTLLVGCSSSNDSSQTTQETSQAISSTISSTTTTSSKASSANSSQASSQEQSSISSTTPETAFNVGELIILDDGLKIKVNSVMNTDEADKFNTAANLLKDHTYEILELTIENPTDQEITVSSLVNFELKDKDGQAGAYVLNTRGNGAVDGKILPNEKMTGELIYQVPKEGELNLYFTSPTENGETIKIKIR